MDKNEKKNQKILKQISKENNKVPFKEKVKQGLTSAKDYFIKDTSKMILLIAIVVAIYLVINLWLNSINLAQIDFTTGKLHTLTDQSKNIVKNINKEMTFYLWEYSESSSVVDLLKQYRTENDKINYKIVSADDYELVSKYGFENNYPQIIGVSEDDRISYINTYDLVSYDDDYNTIDLTEQKLTNAINNLSASEDTNVYFLEGKTNYTITTYLQYLYQYLELEYYHVNTTNLAKDGNIPEDCDILAIMDLAEDLSETEADIICQYIDKGGDMILTLEPNSVNKNRNYPNLQKVLDKYAVSLPNKIVSETTQNSVAGYEKNVIIQPTINPDHEITRRTYIYEKETGYNVKPVFIGTGIIELNTEKQVEQNVTATSILTSSTDSSLENLSTSTTETDETQYVLGVAIQKTVESGEESRAVIFATTSSFSDNQVSSQAYPMFTYNADIILNSFAFSANKGELYSIRKSAVQRKFVTTKEKDKIVKVVIYAIPISIATIGMCVWLNRRKLK